MDAMEKTKEALRVFGEIKRAQAAGSADESTFEMRVAQALSTLTVEEQRTIHHTFVDGLTTEKAAEVEACAASTVSRRKKRALERLTMILYTDQYTLEMGL